MPEPSRRGTRIEGEILLTDHFGNLLTNIPGALLRQPEAMTVQCGGHTFGIVRTYGDAAGHELVALVNSFELLELACPGGNAARTLGLAPGEPVAVRASS